MPKQNNLSEGATQLIEDLAELEHRQWIEWSKEVTITENLSKERLKRWKKLWLPYSMLTEKQKEQDRKWARKVLKEIQRRKEENGKTKS